MENEILTSINDIKTMIYVILAFVIVGLIIIVVIVYRIGLKLTVVKASEKFQFFAEEKMDKGLYQELIKDALELLKDRPNHTYAQWYLAKAYYNLEDYTNAKTYFEKIANRELEWRDNVMPYLNDINENL